MGFLLDSLTDGISAAFGRQKKKEPSSIKDLLSQPDNFIFQGYVEDGKIHIVIQKNEKRTLFNE